MPQLFIILRILLAVPVCGGLCRPAWGHVHEHGAPAERSLVQVIDAEHAKHGDVLDALFSQAAGLHAVPAPSNNGTSCAIAEFIISLVVCVPPLVHESHKNHNMTHAAGSRDEAMGNKDPPSMQPA